MCFFSPNITEEICILYWLWYGLFYFNYLGINPKTEVVHFYTETKSPVFDWIHIKPSKHFYSPQCILKSLSQPSELTWGRQILKNVKTQYSEVNMIFIINGSLWTMILWGNKTSAIRGMNSPKRRASEYLSPCPSPATQSPMCSFPEHGFWLLSHCHSHQQSHLPKDGCSTSTTGWPAKGSVQLFTHSAVSRERWGERDSFLSSVENQPPCQSINFDYPNYFSFQSHKGY